MLAQPILKPRQSHPQATQQLTQQGVHPLLARLFAARGVRSAKEMQFRWAHMLPPARLYDNQRAAALLADAIERSEEHTSELQSRGHLVCRLLLEKKKSISREQQRADT